MLKTYHSGFYQHELLSDTRKCKFYKTGASFLKAEKKGYQAGEIRSHRRLKTCASNLTQTETEKKNVDRSWHKK